jgi:hypothetical protein
VLGDDALDGAREIIRASARTRRRDKFDRFCGLPRGMTRPQVIAANFAFADILVLPLSFLSSFSKR